MRHPYLLSPRFLHILDILPFDFSPYPKLPSTPKNNQTLAVPSYLDIAEYISLLFFFKVLKIF